jgi:hypothetical protein
MASKDPKMSQQGTAGKTKLLARGNSLYINNSSET